MAVIEQVLTTVDSTVATVGASIYGSVATQVAGVVQIAAVLVVILVGINLAIQAIPMTMQNGIGLIVRLGGVAMFISATGSWERFNLVYSALTNAPAEIGAVILSEVVGGGVSNLNEGLDRLYMQSLDVGDAIAQNGSYIAGALAAVIMFLCSALMAVITIIVLSASKLMLGVLVLIGPVAIASTLFKQSAGLFDAYVKVALGFAFVPMLASAMAGFTILVARDVTPSDLSSVESIGDVVSFIVVMLLGAGLLAMVPSMASSLAQTSIQIGAAASSTFSQMGSAGSFGRGLAKGASGSKVSEHASSAARLGNSAGRAANTGYRTAVNLANKARGKPQGK